MKRELVGGISGFLAFITLAEVQLYLGILLAVISVICLIPDVITKWRNLLYDYRKWQTRNGNYSFFAFAYYCFSGLQHAKESKKQLRLPIDYGE